MEYEIVPYTEADVDAMIEIWNEVVNDGVAFPQLDELNHKTGVEFFGKQDFVGVAKVNGEVAGLYILHPNNVQMRTSRQCQLCRFLEMRGIKSEKAGEALPENCQRAGLPHFDFQRRSQGQ